MVGFWICFVGIFLGLDFFICGVGLIVALRYGVVGGLNEFNLCLVFRVVFRICYRFMCLLDKWWRVVTSRDSGLRRFGFEFSFCSIGGRRVLFCVFDGRYL